ncbi:SAM-dependent methyltransferase [Pseudonocardia zijingensis]|uniref:SAM-dependent methyltransferase n=1 Tax=Pseudonocardia zijingensis TaxID=153376 RepID=UPI0031D93187
MTGAARTWDVRTGVGATAVVAAAGRAVETHRQDGLLDDPYAEALVLAAGPPGNVPTRPGGDGEHGNWRALSDLVGIRGKFFDDAARRAAGFGVRQVVLLASGLDTRAHRLDWPAGTVLFEIDQPAVLEFKNQVLRVAGAQARCDRRPVPADLREGWPDALRDAGFDPGRATLWIAEGLLYYLTPDGQRGLLESVHALSAPGSRWAIEDDPHFLERMDDPEARASSEALGLDLRSLLGAGARPDPGEWLRTHGWIVESRTLRTAASEYGRTLTPVGERVNGPFVLVNARKA